MKVGTIEPLADEQLLQKRRSRLTSGGQQGGNNGNDDGGDDDSGKYSGSASFDPMGGSDESPDKAKVVTWFLLLVVVMTFGGLIGAYVVISTNRAAEWNPFDLPAPVWISTVLIFISSFTYHLAKKAIDARKEDAIRRWLIATTVLGSAFISSQIMAWLALVDKGLYLSGNPYAGFFYILTGAHAVHVIGGIVALGAILLRSWNETEYGPEIQYRKNLARSVGWYWHFMGVLWLVLFVLLGFWK